MNGNGWFVRCSALHLSSRGHLERSLIFFGHLSALGMEKPVVTFRHCGKDIYTFSKTDVTLNQCVSEGSVCPVCRNPVVFGLLDAPVALPSPFTNGHETQCSFLLGAKEGPWYLGYV